ncbi:MAG: acyl-CoA dehydrogenase family protein [Alphaproteobacteria bacterium]
MENAGSAGYESYKKRLFQFLWREVEPLVDRIDSGAASVEALFERFREHRLWGLVIPEAYGGLGLAVGQYLPILAELAKVGGVIRVVIHVHNTAARALAAFGTEEQKRRWLPALAEGRSSMTFALTEPDSGSGMDITTTARREGEHYAVNGAKHFITNAAFADLHLVCCRTGTVPDRRALSALVVERGTKGFTIEPMPHLMGANGPAHGILRFEDARVPVENIVGREGDGLEIFLGELEPSRVFVAASALGAAERALEMALDYAKRRVTFGRPIGAREGVRGKLAEMARDVYALKAVLEDVARKLDGGKPAALEASIAKLLALEAVVRVTDAGMEVLGGRAYVRNYPYPFERLYREARLNVLEEGTPTIQRLVIARALLAEDVPLGIGTLGERAHPAGVDPALGHAPGALGRPAFEKRERPGA